MKLQALVLALALGMCIGTLGCMNTSGPSAARNEEGPIPPRINQKTPQGKVGIRSPWIFDGKPGIFTPSDDFKTGEINGLVHGMSVISGEKQFIIEQWLLMKDTVEMPYNGIKLAKFPKFLPLVQEDTVHIDKLYWGFGRYPFGFPSPTMTYKEFYDWAVPIMAPKEHPVFYGLGGAQVFKGIPPDHLDGSLGKDPIDLDTEGYLESFNVTNKCPLVVFAELKFSRYTSSKKILDRFEHSRRFVQAYDTKNCMSLSGMGTNLSIASTDDSPHKYYRDFLNVIKGWKDAEVSYADGDVLLDDNFTGEPLDLGDIKKEAVLLLTPKQK